MPIFAGGDRVGDLYVGGQRIERAYLGSTLVYQPDDGFLDEFNRTVLGPNWSVQGSPLNVSPGQACTEQGGGLSYMTWTRPYMDDDVRVNVTVGDGLTQLGVVLGSDAATVSELSTYVAATWAETWEGGGEVRVAAYLDGQEVLSVGASIRAPEPGDVFTAQRQGDTVIAAVNGVEVLVGVPSPLPPVGADYRNILLMLVGCITRFEATAPGTFDVPRREVKEFTTPGTTTYTLPEWVAHMRVLRWGGGGGGGGGDGAAGRTGDGGRAGAAHVTDVGGNHARTWGITVGAGGAGGAKEGTGGTGEQSRIGAMIAAGGAGGSGYSGSGGRTADSLTLRDGTTVSGGSGGSNNQDGSAPGGGGGAGTGGVFGSAKRGRKGGDGRVIIDMVDQAWIDAFGTGE